MKDKKSILFLISAIAVLFLVNAVFGPVNITKAANSPVTGYAWSDNIGWIQMNPAFGGVQVDSSTGNFSGYAWSDNIGWVDFAPTSGFPEAPNEGAKLNLSTGQITGWIKAIAADNNGWDGWIKMSGSWSNGVSVNLATGAFSGYAWGSDVVGWVSFSGSGYGVTMNPLAPTVNISSSPPNPIDYNTSATLTWTSANVTSCDASGDWSGGKATSGSESTGNLTSAKTYTITCAGPGGTASNSVTVNVGGALSCALPWGGTISHGSNVTAYSTDQVACGVSCSGVSETRTCNNGVLSGSYINQSCLPADCPDFSLSSSGPILASLVGGAPSVSTETTIIVSPQNLFASDVALSIKSVSPALSGATFNFTDSSLSSSEYSTGTKFSVNVPSGTSSGLYTITIKGEGGELIRTVDVRLNVENVEPKWIEI